MFSIHATTLGSLQLGNICECVGLFGLVGGMGVREWGWNIILHNFQILYFPTYT